MGEKEIKKFGKGIIDLSKNGLCPCDVQALRIVLVTKQIGSSDPFYLGIISIFGFGSSSLPHSPNFPRWSLFQGLNDEIFQVHGDDLCN